MEIKTLRTCQWEVITLLYFYHLKKVYGTTLRHTLLKFLRNILMSTSWTEVREVQMINVLPHIISPNLIRMKKIWKDLNTEYFEKLIYFYAALAIFSANETWGAKPSQNHPPPFQNKKRLASWFSGRRLKMWGRWGPMGTIKTVCCKRYGYARDIGDAFVTVTTYTLKM